MSELSDQVKSKNEKKKEPVINRDNKIRTGCTLLDLIIGGGWSWGTIVNVVGDKSTGKTYFTLETIAMAKKILGSKLKFFYDDVEGGFSFNTKEMYGYEVIQEDQTPSLTVESFAGNLSKQIEKLKSDEYLIYVVDALDGLSSQAERSRDSERQKALEAGKDYDKGTYAMEKQKFMSEFFRLRAGEIKNKNVLLIIISQVRDNIGVMFGAKYKRAGGKALDFYANIILWLAEAEKLKKKDATVGICVKAKTEKAKIKTPFRFGFVDLIFDYGLDDVTTNINYLYDLKTETGKEKKRQKIEWNGEEHTPKGLVKYIEENNLEEELRVRVIKKWNDFEASISSEGRKAKW